MTVSHVGESDIYFLSDNGVAESAVARAAASTEEAIGGMVIASGGSAAARTEGEGLLWLPTIGELRLIADYISAHRNEDGSVASRRRRPRAFHECHRGNISRHHEWRRDADTVGRR